MTRNVTVFAVAALLEIAGCFAFWAWLLRGVTPFVLVFGIASLIGFALALTRVDSTFAGRASGCGSSKVSRPPAPISSALHSQLQEHW